MNPWELYIGTKCIAAQPMTEFDFYIYKGKPFDKNNENSEGYLVQYEDGYESWSPKYAFEKAYRRIDSQTESFIKQFI